MVVAELVEGPQRRSVVVGSQVELVEYELAAAVAKLLAVAELAAVRLLLDSWQSEFE